MLKESQIFTSPLHVLLGAPRASAAAPGRVEVPLGPRRIPGRRRFVGARAACSARALLQQLAEGGDVDLRHLQGLGLGQLPVAVRVGNNAAEPVKGHVQSEHPAPLAGIGR